MKNKNQLSSLSPEFISIIRTSQIFMKWLFNNSSSIRPNNSSTSSPKHK